MRRKQYAYRIDVTYPEGSREPGWEPDAWPEICKRHYWPTDDHNGDTTFRWPKPRLFLSLNGAENRARRLREVGAHAVVVRSREIEWPSPDVAGELWSAAFALRGASNDPTVHAISEGLVELAKRVVA